MRTRPTNSVKLRLASCSQHGLVDLSNTVTGSYTLSTPRSSLRPRTPDSTCSCRCGRSPGRCTRSGTRAGASSRRRSSPGSTRIGRPGGGSPRASSPKTTCDLTPPPMLPPMPPSTRPASRLARHARWRSATALGSVPRTRVRSTALDLERHPVRRWTRSCSLSPPPIATASTGSANPGRTLPRGPRVPAADMCGLGGFDLPVLRRPRVSPLIGNGSQKSP